MASGFCFCHWFLDVGSCQQYSTARALLADLSGPDQCNYANAIFCSWMALGNILGFSAGSGGQWYRWFPFLNTRACCEACANLKGAFVVSVVFLMFCTFVTLYFAKETPLVYVGNNLSDTAPLLNDSRQLHNVQLSTADIWSGDKNGSEASMATHKNNIENSSLSNAEGGVEALVDEPSGVLVNLLTSLRHLAPGMNAVLVVMAFTWMAWFPFFLYDTDWMGRAVYHGNPNGNSTEVQNYDKGVRDGAFGLLLNSVVLLFSSFGVEPMCKILGAKVVWGISNFIIFACMLSTVFISFLSKGSEMNGTIRVASLLLFSILGVPLSITYSVPFSMTAELTADTGGGQGLATGVLNLAIVIPQMILSLGAGPLDAIFESGNDPAFILASAFSLMGGIIAIIKLPTLSYRSPGLHGFA